METNKENPDKKLEEVKMWSVFKKAMATLKYLVNELQIRELYSKVLNETPQISTIEFNFVLIRISALLKYRDKLIQVFQAVSIRERKLMALKKGLINLKQVSNSSDQ